MESTPRLENNSRDNNNNIKTSFNDKFRNLFNSIISFFILFFTSLIYPIKNDDENNSGIYYFILF
jgi:hypothetical protein